MVIRSAQLAVAAQPGMGSLGDPALRLHLKAPLSRQSLNNLQLTRDVGRYPHAHDTSIGLVRPHLLQADAARFGRRKHLLCYSIIQPCQAGYGSDQQVQRVGQQIPLAPKDLFTVVETPFWPASNTPLGALDVDHTACRLDALPPLGVAPNPQAQHVVYLHQSAFLDPLLQGGADCALRRKRTRQQPPPAAALQLGAQAVEHCSQVCPLPRFGLGLHLDIRADQILPLTSQIVWGALGVDNGVRQCYHLSVSLGQTVGLSNLILPLVRIVSFMRVSCLRSCSGLLTPLFEY